MTLPENRNEATRLRRQELRLQLVVSISLFLAGVTVSCLALARIVVHEAHAAQLAQAQPDTMQNDPSRGQTSGSSAPAESKPGGTRPTTPAPEPATPDTDAQKAGAPTALPSAPAEKTAPPINSK